MSTVICELSGGRGVVLLEVGFPGIKGSKGDEGEPGDAARTPVVDLPAGRPLQSADAGRKLRYTGAAPSDVLVPPSSVVLFPVGTLILLSQADENGSITFLEGPGVRIGAHLGRIRTSGIYAQAALHYVGDDLWELTGELEEAGL